MSHESQVLKLIQTPVKVELNTMKILQSTVQIKVPFEDVDMFEIVWHGNFAKYFEAARCALLDDIGHNYKSMRDAGIMYPVVDVQFKFLKPIVFGQTIDVVATLVEWEHMLKFEYEIRDSASDTLVAKGSSKQAAVIMETMQLLRVCPNDLAIKILAAMGRKQNKLLRTRSSNLRRKLKQRLVKVNPVATAR